MAKILKILGNYGYVGTDFEYFLEITGSESYKELEDMAREEILSNIDWNYEIVEEDDG